MFTLLVCSTFAVMQRVAPVCKRQLILVQINVTFRARRSRGEMFIGHGRLCVCVSVFCLSLAAFPYYCTDPDVSWGNGGSPLAVHYWVDLQSVHEFRCYENIVPNAKCQRVLVLALCLVYFVRILASCSAVHLPAGVSR